MRSCLPLPPRGSTWRAVVCAAALSVAAVSCTGSSNAGSDPAPPATSTSSTSTSTTAPDAADAVDVAVVADSEVPADVVDRLDGRSDISVSSRVTQPGWTIEQLDDGLNAALATEPDVLVYSAGANDLQSKGISGMLGLLEQRITEAKAAMCVVFIVPAVDTASMQEPERSQADQLLAAFGEVASGWGVTVVSYPEIAAAMAADGGRFFGEGGLGSFHPGSAAYDRIAESIAKEIASCP